MCKPGLLLCLLPITILLGLVRGLRGWSRRPDGVVSPGYDGSLYLGLRCSWNLRAWGCTSMLISFFPRVCPLVRGWIRTRGIGVTPLNWPQSLLSVHRDVYFSDGGLCPGANFHPLGVCAET